MLAAASVAMPFASISSVPVPWMPLDNISVPPWTSTVPVLLKVTRTSVVPTPCLLNVPSLVKVAPAPVSPAPSLPARMKLEPAVLAVQVPAAALSTVPLPATAAPVRRLLRSTLPFCVTVPWLRKIRPPSRRRSLVIVVAPCAVVVAAPDCPPSPMVTASEGASVRFDPVIWPKSCAKVPLPPIVFGTVKLTTLSPLIRSVPAIVVVAVLNVCVVVPAAARLSVAPLSIVTVPLCASAPTESKASVPACTCSVPVPVLLKFVRTVVVPTPCLLKVPSLVKVAPAPVSPAP